MLSEQEGVSCWFDLFLKLGELTHFMKDDYNFERRLEAVVV